MFLVQYLGRKTMMIIGAAIQAVTLLLAGLAFWQGYQIFGFILINLTTVAWIISEAGIGLYALETVPDIVYVVYSSAGYVATGIAALTSKSIRDSALGDAGFLWLFAVFNFLGVFYLLFFVKETKGLTDI